MASAATTSSPSHTSTESDHNTAPVHAEVQRDHSSVGAAAPLSNQGGSQMSKSYNGKSEAALPASEELATNNAESDARNDIPIIPEEQRYFSIFDKEIASERKAFLKPLLFFFGLTTIILWCVLPIFWGSTLLQEYYFPRLHIDVVDFDSIASGSSALVGPRVSAILASITAASGPHLTYEIVDPTTKYPGGYEQVMEAVRHSGPWGAVVIFDNATTAWTDAVQNGVTTYDPTGSVGIYFAGARFYQVVLLFLSSLLSENVHDGVYAASQAATAQFLCGNTDATALTTAAPAALGTAFSFFQYDVSPITAWASAAPMEAGLIYVTIFTFHFALVTFFGRMFSGLNNRLKLLSLIKMRLLAVTVMYFFLSLWYTCLNAAFQEPLYDHVGRAGFVVFWALNFVTLFALGLAMESMISLVTIKFFPFFLIFWIITNLTSSFLPIDIMQPFYRWGYAFPFYQNVQATKIILYGILPNHFLGQYFGVLFAWSGVNLVFLPFCVWVERRRFEKGKEKERREKEGQKGE